MPIDISVKGSPGWWLQRLMNQLNFRERRGRLELLNNYLTGRAPLPETAENAREAFEAFLRKSRSNFAELIVSAVSERMVPVGFKTAVDSDVTGDAEVGDIWELMGMDVTSNHVQDMMLGLSESYVIVGDIDPETGAPMATAEDPRWIIGERDPSNKRRLLAALKVMFDSVEDEYRAYVYLPGKATNSKVAEVWVATKAAAGYDIVTPNSMWKPMSPVVTFSAEAWDWNLERSGALKHPLLPVVRFDNKSDVGEFEHHLDTLDRINSQILWRLSIELLQAYKQRAVKGLPLEDAYGNTIDYSEVFTADPAALWQLPATAEMWESAEVNLQPILSAVKDDVQHLSAVTRTPMHILAPESANQSAEGASFAREALVFKTWDRIKRTGPLWAKVMQIALLQMGQTERADLTKLKTIWLPPERLSLAEKAAADAQAVNTIPRRSRLIYIWGFSPPEADQIMTEVHDEQLLQMQMAMITGQANAAVAGQQNGGVPGAPVHVPHAAGSGLSGPAARPPRNNSSQSQQLGGGQRPPSSAGSSDPGFNRVSQPSKTSVPTGGAT